MTYSKHLYLLQVFAFSLITDFALATATVTVSPVGGSTTVCSSVSVGYSTGISGADYTPYYYEWRLNSGSGGGDIIDYNGNSHGAYFYSTQAGISVVWSQSGPNSVSVNITGSQPGQYIGSGNVSITVGTSSILSYVTGPTVICQHAPQVTLTGYIGSGVSINPQYQWYDNGSAISGETSSTLSTTVQNGHYYQFRIYSTCSGWSPITSYGPGNPPTTSTSDTYLVNFTPSFTPEMHVTVLAGACFGQSINFSVSSNNLTSTDLSNATYTWTHHDLNYGNHPYNNAIFSPSAHTSSNIPNAYSPGDAVDVTVTLSGGTCLTQSSFTLPAPSVSVLPVPGGPANPISNSICGPGRVTLSATSGTDADQLKWTSLSDGSVAFSNSSQNFQPDIESTTQYSVVSYNSSNHCVSQSGLTITGTVKEIPLPPTSNGPFSRCGPGPLTLSVASEGNEIVWYEQSGAFSGTVSSNTLEATTQTLVESATFNAFSRNSLGCFSGTFTSIIATINPLPEAPIIAPAKAYEQSSVDLTASTPCSACTIKWYSSISGSSIGQGPVYSTGALSQTTSYYASATEPLFNCPSDLQEVIVTIVKDLNSVMVYEVTIPNVTEPAAVEEQSYDKVIKSAGYFDGLGRPVQTIIRKNSPATFDVVTPVIYDPVGNESKKYLPFVFQQTGLFKLNEQIIGPTGEYTGVASAFYGGANKVASDSKPYSQVIFEKSPLNRIKKVGGAGVVWQPVNDDPYSSGDHTVVKTYSINANDEVKLVIYDPTTNMVSSTTSYAANMLKVIRTVEGDNELTEYFDRNGHLICKKEKLDNVTYAYTYYVYDDFGNLVVVLPPEAVKNIID